MSQNSRCTPAALPIKVIYSGAYSLRLLFNFHLPFLTAVCPVFSVAFAHLKKVPSEAVAAFPVLHVAVPAGMLLLGQLGLTLGEVIDRSGTINKTLMSGQQRSIHYTCCPKYRHVVLGPMLYNMLTSPAVVGKPQLDPVRLAARPESADRPACHVLRPVLVDVNVVAPANAM